VIAAAGALKTPPASIASRYRAWLADGTVFLVPFAIIVFNTDPDPLVTVLGSQLLALLYFVILLSVLLDDQRRGWHDNLAESLVIAE